LFEEYSANFTAGGKSYSTGTFEYSPSGTVSAPLVAAKNFGCETVSIPFPHYHFAKTKSFIVL